MSRTLSFLTEILVFGDKAVLKRRSFLKSEDARIGIDRSAGFI